MTISDAFAVETGSGSRSGSAPVAVEEARVGSGPRARVAPRSVLVNIFGSWGRQTWSDLRDAWWTPAALPTFQQAWAERMPDRDRVPGNNSALYALWVGYNHSIGLAVPLAAVLLVGALTPLLWIARHPARLALFLIISTALYALTLG